MSDRAFTSALSNQPIEDNELRLHLQLHGPARYMGRLRVFS
jgi:hypothetical protein